MRLARQLLIFAGSVLAALALLVGVPAVLAAGVGWPLPRTVPAVGDVVDALGRGGASDDAVLKTFAVVAWVAWVHVAFVFITETAATARRTVPRVTPAGRLTHGLVRPIVDGLFWASTTVGVMSTAVPAAAGPVPPAITALNPLPVSHGEHLRLVTPAGAATIELNDTATPSESELHPYRVQAGDTLWDLAERHLGDGFRWREIWDASLHATQRADALDDPNALPTGALLHFPADAVDLPTPAAEDHTLTGPDDQPVTSTEARTEVWRVEDGDHFWGVAEETLAEAWERTPSDVEVVPYWEDLIEANRNRLLPPHDPDLIYPDQELVLPPVPDNANDAVVVPLTPRPVPPPDRLTAPAAPPPPQSETPPDDVASPAPVPMPEDRHSPDTDVDVHSDTDTDTDTDVRANAHSRNGDGDGDGGRSGNGNGNGDRKGNGGAATVDLTDESAAPVAIGAAALGGGLLAAGALLELRRRRRYRLSQRPPGTIPETPTPAHVGTERSLARTAADDDAWVWAALAHLRFDAPSPARPLLALLDHDRLDLLLTEPARPHPDSHWTPAETGDGVLWQLDRRIEGNDLGNPEENPYPTMVSVGDGYLLDLVTTGVLTLEGDDDLAEGLARAIVHELSFNPSNIHLDIRIAADLPGVDWFAYPSADLADLTDEVLNWLNHLTTPPPDTGAGDEAEPVAPLLIVAAAAELAHHPDLLAAAADPNVPVACLVLGDTIDTPYRIELGPTTVLHPWKVRFQPNQLTVADTAELASLLTHAVQAPMGSAPEPSITSASPHPAVDGSGPGHLLPAAWMSAGTDASTEGDHDGDAETPSPVTAGERTSAAPDTTQQSQSTEEQPLEGRVPEGDEVTQAADGREGGAHGSLQLRLLGPISVADVALSPQQLAVVTYLSLHGEVPRARLIDAIWDGQRIGDKRVHSMLTELRARIGRDHLPECTNGRYYVTGITSDLAEFEAVEAVAREARTTGDIATETTALTKALELVDGPPLIPPSTRYWGWLSEESTEALVEARIADAAHRLAQLRASQDDWEGSIWAARKGNAASPTDQSLVMDLLTAHKALGRPGVAERLVSDWEETIAKLGVGDPDEAPRRLLAG